MKSIDLRSDTVTQPTPEMLDAMRNAELGDEGYGDDPTLNRLEELTAARVGKEAALFTASGTLGNLASVMAHTSPSDEIIVGHRSHILCSEKGGISAVAGCLVRTVQEERGMLPPDEVKALCRAPGTRPRTGLVCVENTHNSAGGVTLSLENLRSLRDTCDEFQIPLHMDGARVFNAAVATGVDVREITQYVDSLMFCLSKGLGAPIGSMVAGSTEFIQEVRAMRDMLGGRMRQTGVIAAAGIWALQHRVDRLAQDHDNARLLAEGLSDLGFDVDTNLVDTNIVFIRHPTPQAAQQQAQGFSELGIMAKASGNRIRLVTHYQVNTVDVERVIERLRTDECKR